MGKRCRNDGVAGTVCGWSGVTERGVAASCPSPTTRPPPRCQEGGCGDGRSLGSAAAGARSECCPTPPALGLLAVHGVRCVAGACGVAAGVAAGAARVAQGCGGLGASGGAAAVLQHLPAALRHRHWGPPDGHAAAAGGGSEHAAGRGVTREPQLSNESRLGSLPFAFPT